MTQSGTGRPLALVTGASSGIGYELANQFAQHGYDLVIAAEDDGITQAARDLADMVDRGTGRILITSSIAGTMPGAFEAVYAASKAMHRKQSEPGSGTR